MFHPGRLTLNFLKGQRAAYVNPLRLYLTMSLIFFVLHAMDHDKTAFKVDIPPSEIANVERQLELSAEDSMLLKAFTSLPGMKNVASRIQKHPDEFEHLFQAGFPKAIFFLVPVFALLLQASYGFRRRYPQYLYFALHFHAAYFALLILGTLLKPIWGNNSLTIIWAAIYLGMAMKKVWGGSTRGAILRVGAIAVSYLFFFVIALLAVMGYAVYNLSA